CDCPRSTALANEIGIHVKDTYALFHMFPGRARVLPTYGCLARTGRVNVFPTPPVLYCRSMQATALIFEMARTAAHDAFDRIVRQREAQILRIAYRILGNWTDAEDVAQEA